jgi:hypothetical protein
MHRRTFVVALIAVLLALPLIAFETEAYSDPTGIYARVDRVVLEPNATAPERIQIWGAIALARKEDRNNYEPAQRGYLYFSCPADKMEVCRKEWADLKAMAGTDQVVGFGGRQQARPRLRRADEKAANPDPYPLNFGLVKVSEMRSGHPPIPELKALPKQN